MRELCERITREGRNLEQDSLNVGSVINHQVDASSDLTNKPLSSIEWE